MRHSNLWQNVAATVRSQAGEVFDTARSTILVIRNESNELAHQGFPWVKPWLLSLPMPFRRSTNVKRAGARTTFRKVVLEEATSLFSGDVLNLTLEATGKGTRYPFEDVACKVCKR